MRKLAWRAAAHDKAANVRMEGHRNKIRDNEVGNLCSPDFIQKPEMRYHRSTTAP